MHVMNGRGTYLFHEVKTELDFKATHWVEPPMPYLIIELLNILWRVDNTNKVKSRNNDRVAEV